MISRVFCVFCCLGLMLSTIGIADEFGPLDGDVFFIAPGAGTETGFQIAGGPYENSVVDGDGEIIGPDFGGGMILSTDSLIHNGGNNYDLIFRIESIGGNIMPSGIIGNSGVELTTLGLFVGGGIDSVALAAPLFAEEAQIEVFNTAAESIGTINVIDFGNFTAGVGGGWDGSFGLNFADEIPIGDVGAVELQINFNVVPEPASCSVIALAAMGLISYRRRKAS